MESLIAPLLPYILLMEQPAKIQILCPGNLVLDKDLIFKHFDRPQIRVERGGVETFEGYFKDLNFFNQTFILYNQYNENLKTTFQGFFRTKK